jgi:hypothetical protein
VSPAGFEPAPLYGCEVERCPITTEPPTSECSWLSSLVIGYHSATACGTEGCQLDDHHPGLHVFLDMPSATQRSGGDPSNDPKEVKNSARPGAPAGVAGRALRKAGVQGVQGADGVTHFLEEIDEEEIDVDTTGTMVLAVEAMQGKTPDNAGV